MSEPSEPSQPSETHESATENLRMSDPPQVKVARAHWGALQNMFGMAVVSAIMWSHPFSIELYLGAIGVLGGLTLFPAMRGKPPVGALALVGKPAAAMAAAMFKGGGGS